MADLDPDEPNLPGPVGGESRLTVGLDGKTMSMRLSRLTERLEAASVVDRVGQPANQAAHRVIPSGRVKDGLSGSWLGHPLHPVLVMVPIGSWTSASLIDLALGGRSSPAARRLVGLGVLSALRRPCPGWPTGRTPPAPSKGWA